jgi:hypothetical protein
MVATNFKVLVLLMAAFYMGACAHHTVVVKCDGKLEPINVPAPKSAEAKPDPSKAAHTP